MGRFGQSLLGVVLIMLLSRAALADSRAWLELEAEELTGGASGAAWVEIRGSAQQADPNVDLDLVVALDVSDSSFVPAGFDVDGDGVLGRWRSSGLGTAGLSDPGDSVAAAGIQSLRELLQRLDRAHANVALTAFSDRSRLIAPFCSAQRASQHASELRVRQQGRGTNLALAIRHAQRLLESQREARGPHGAPRAATILLLSDAEPTLPGSAATSLRYAARASVRAREAGSELIAFSPARRESRAHAAGSTVSGVRRFSGGTIDDLVRMLRPGSPVEIRSLRIWNRETGREGRATRFFANGSFDGFAPLVVGRNAVAVHVELTDGRTLDREISVAYRPGIEPGAAVRVLERMRTRSVEVELQRELARSRGAGPRAKRVEVVPDETSVEARRVQPDD